MKLICPSCGAVHSAEGWQNDEIARQALKLAGEMHHDVSSRCFAYLALFRPPSRSLSWKKVLRLLAELKELSGAAHIQWNKNVARPNFVSAWGLAMEKMIENPPKRLPLKSHGYLHAIAYETADEADRRSEVKRNKLERTGNYIRGEQKTQPEKMSMEEIKKITQKNYWKGRRR